MTDTDAAEPVNVPTVNDALASLGRPLDALGRAAFAHAAVAALGGGGENTPGAGAESFTGTAPPSAPPTLKPKRKRPTR